MTGSSESGRRRGASSPAAGRHVETRGITALILEAAERARRQTGGGHEPEYTRPVQWPVACTVGPGLEGAIACESSVGYVNGSKGRLIYRGYDVFDLCAHSTFEEVSYLLLHGELPTEGQLARFEERLVQYRFLPHTMRHLMGFPVQEMNAMAALRIGTSMMRQRLTWRDQEIARPEPATAIGTDEDSIPMETVPTGEEHAIYEFKRRRRAKPRGAEPTKGPAADLESCCHLIAGLATITAGIARLRQDRLPIEPDPSLGHAANFLYMTTGRRPSPEEERVMDIALILHADHGMNASTFAAMVVASTLSDIYWAVGSGIAALTGPLHGGANEQVLHQLRRIGRPERVGAWFKRARARKKRIMGFGHRVYKTYDPRARVLGPLAGRLAAANPFLRPLFRTAEALEAQVVSTLGVEKGVFPNVDFYSGLVYAALGVPPELFTSVFAVSRVAGWTARVLEYLRNNRIFRPRAMYVGKLDKQYVPIRRRGRRASSRRLR